MPSLPAEPAVPRRLSWWQGWIPLAVLPLAIGVLFPAAWPRWGLMWSVAFAVYGGLKWLTWRRATQAAPAWKHAGYLLAWPGMDAPAFLGPATARPPGPGEWMFAAAKFLFGVSALWGLARQVPAELAYVQGWAGMVGIIFVLHFGSFHLLSCGWRSLGVQARPLMNWPVASCSVSEFWGRRWNTAFRDLTHQFLFRPLTRRLGPVRATVAGFAFSGLVHDLAISWPAGDGYGLPTLYFIIQLGGLLLERTPTGQARGLGRGPVGWLFTMAVLLVPLPILFHPPFVLNVIVPFLRDVRAVP